MKHRFLGIISILYVLIIIYLCLTNNLNNILAPQLQIYTKLSILPLLLVGLVFIFNKREFKKTDFVLLLPILMIILSGDFRLDSSFVINKEVSNENNKIDNKYSDTIDTSKYNFKNIDFDVIDASYSSISDALMYTTKPDYYVGKTIRIRGLSLKNSKIVGTNYFMVGKYLITCCAADAGFVGFVINYDTNNIKDNTWYQIEGVLKKVKLTDGSYVVGIKAVNIIEINDKEENQYVYPCYSYSDTCSDVTKYNLE